MPRPVAQPATEESLEFINLEDYATFFEDLEAGFATDDLELGATTLFDEPAAAAALVVHDVGEFEASFVPTVARVDDDGDGRLGRILPG